MILNLNKISLDELERYAKRFYYNPQIFSDDEFKLDFKLFTFTKRLLKRYMLGQSINLVIVLNNIITLNNLFGARPAGVILMFYCQEEMWPYIGAFLDYLSILPQDEQFVNINFHPDIVNFLGQL